MIRRLRVVALGVLVRRRSPAVPVRDRLGKEALAARADLDRGVDVVEHDRRAQGGEVVVGENPGGGAVITIYLPHSAPETVVPQ